MKLNYDFLGVAIIVLCIAALIVFGAYALVTGKSLEPINLILTNLVGVISLLVGYFWGSSKSSKDKTELLVNSKG